MQIRIVYELVVNDNVHASILMTYYLMKTEIKWSALLMGNDLAHGQLNAEWGSWIRNEVQELRVRLKNSEWDSTIRSDFLEFGVGFKNSVWGSRIRSKVVSWNSDCTCDPPYALASCPGLCIFDIASLFKRPIFLLFYCLNSLCNPITLSEIRMQVLCFYFSTFRWYFLSFNKRFFL